MIPMLRTLATGDGELPVVLNQPGWWRRDIRYVYEPVKPAQGNEGLPVTETWDETRPLLITGATGTLGRAFAHACKVRGLPFVLTDRKALRLDDPASVAAAIEKHQPWAVINTAGWVRVTRRRATSTAACAPTPTARRCWPRPARAPASPTSPTPPTWCSTAGETAPTSRATRLRR
jgi:dTDP-4-dehydrorhamnose reductase